MTEDERRAHPRAEVRIQGLLCAASPDRPEFIRQRPVTVVDLSERGALVSLRAEPGFSDALTMESVLCRLSLESSIHLPSDIQARAVWNERAASGTAEVRIGLFFENCPPGTLAALRAYVADCLKSGKTG